MATSQVAKWTVVVVVEEDEGVTASYRMSPNTKLSELMKIWKDDFELIGYWMFVSASEEITLHDDSITLEMVGETAPRIVTLRARIVDEPTSEIFVYLKDKFHHLCVKPHDKLYDVLWRLPEKPNSMEYNGLPLNVMHTIQQSGLKNKSVLYEPLCSVAVKMSSGYTNVFQMSPNSIVLQLKEKVNVYETNDFSLKYQGRYLKSDESVRLLTQVVEVTTAQFVVNFQDQCVSWITKKEPIEVSDFLCQFAARANIDTQTLDRFEFVCVGCQRRICQSNYYVQKLPVECCAEMSLTLDAVSLSDSGTTSEANDVTKLIQTLHKHLVQHRKDSRSATSRNVCREIKDKLIEEGLDFNIVTRCSDSLLKQITELEDKIKELNVIIETLKNKKSELEKETEWLQSRDVRAMEEIEILKKENRKQKNEHNSEIEILRMHTKNLVEKNKEMAKENERLKKEQKSVSLKTNPRGAIGPGPSRSPTSDEERGVKLLVVYYRGHFSPASCPDVAPCGRWPFSSFSSYAKCLVHGIRPGWTPFKEVVAVLQPLFSGRKISEIQQWLGSAAGRTVTSVTSRDGDEAARYDKSPYCGVDGAEHSWQEAGEPSLKKIIEGGSVFVCGGERRTVLEILPWL